MRTTGKKGHLLLAGVMLASVLAACGSDTKSSSGATTTAAGGATTTAAPSAGSTTTAAGATTTTAAATGGTTDCKTPSGDAIKLAVNPWTGSAVNAYVAKAVIECNLGTPVDIVNIDENATWAGLDKGSLDAALEVWPSGHAADYETYVTQKKSVVDIGKLGPSAQIGWYIPKYVLDAHPELATWEGFKDPKLAKLFATAESGDLGQFLMGDPSYVTYDAQIIASLKLPLKFVVAGSEAALLTAMDKAVAAKTPILLQFWQPHWKWATGLPFVRVKLPDVTDACKAAAKAGGDGYACDYPVDELYKAASAKLKDKNSKVFDLLSKLTLTTDQQNQIASYVDSDKMKPADAAQKWVDANKAVWQPWLG
jgi:glycine betaine/proline transport system substrate-binding protein